MWKCVFPFSSSHMHRIQLLQPHRILLSNWKRNYIYTKLHYYTHTRTYAYPQRNSLLCSPENKHRCPLCTCHDCHTEGRCIDWWEHRIPDPSIRYSRYTIPCHTDHFHCRGLGTPLGKKQEETRQSDMSGVWHFPIRYFWNILPLKTLE